MKDPQATAVVATLLTYMAWRVLGDSGRQKVGEFVNGILAAAEQQRIAAQREAEQRLAEAHQVHPVLKTTAQLVPGPAVSPIKSILLGLPAVTETDARWKDIIRLAGVILILGSRGAGKSALAYRLLELLRYRLTPYVVAMPTSARRLLPDWIGMVPSIQDLPSKCIALVDEAYLQFHSRSSSAQESKEMSQAINLARQREQVLIFVTQEARQVDRNIASSASVVVLKNLGMLQLEFDRPELRKLVIQAKGAFARLRGDPQRWAYVYAPDADFAGLLENEMATFWTPGLSRVFSQAQSTPARRHVARMSPTQKAAKAKELRARNLSYDQIAVELGVSKASVSNYLRGYPYRPSRPYPID